MHPIAQLGVGVFVSVIAGVLALVLLRRYVGPDTDAPIESQPTGTILIVSSDVSGDVLAETLLPALLRESPNLRCVALGGERMRRTGALLLDDPIPLSLMGVSEIARRVFKMWRWVAIIRKAKAAIKIERPDRVIAIAGPTLGLAVAREANRNHVKCAYYSLPEVWAWHWAWSRDRSSLRKVLDNCDLVLPINRLEYDVYRNYAARAGKNTAIVFHGHPFVDMVAPSMTVDDCRKRWSLPSGIKVVGLLPTSRMQELRLHLETVLDATELIWEQLNGNVRFFFFIAEDYLGPSIGAALKDRIEKYGKDRGYEIQTVNSVSAERYDTLAMCDAAILKSGTVTLEAACLGVPAVVIYKAPQLDYLLKRLRIIKLTLPNGFMAMPNILAGQKLYEELQQNDLTAGRIADATLSLLRLSPLELASLHKKLADLRNSLGQPGVVSRVAREILLRTYDTSYASAQKE